MEFFSAMTGFAGRLNRRPYWIASLVLLVVVIALLALVTWLAVATMNLALVNGLSFVVLVAIIYPSTALMVRRFHDRDKSGKWVLLLIVPALVVSLTNLMGFTGKPVPIAADQFDLDASFFTLWGQSLAYQARQQPVDFAFNVWFTIVGLWFFIELGFFKGTRGLNRYGPDPLEGTAASG